MSSLLLIFRDNQVYVFDRRFFKKSEVYSFKLPTQNFGAPRFYYAQGLVQTFFFFYPEF